MSLLDVRKKFIELSGRFDLVSSVVVAHNLDAGSNDLTDKGADFFIQGGQRLLDRLLEFPKQHAEVELDLATGDHKVYLPVGVRSVLGVALEDDSEDAHYQLEKANIRELRSAYGPLADADKDTPSYYALGFPRSETLGNATVESQGLLTLMPPADGQYKLRVKTLLESDLPSDSSDNFWTLRFPDLLVWAALYKLEVSYRNTQGAQDWLNAIHQEIELIDSDVVAQEAAEVDTLNSPWDTIKESDRATTS